MIRVTSPSIGRRVLSTVLFFAIAASSVAAEETKPDPAAVGTAVAPSPPLMPGQRLRVTASSPAFTGVTVGNLVKIASDRLTLVDAERGAVTELLMSSVTRIELGHQHRQTKKWLLIGLAIGAVGAIAVSADNSQSCGGYGEPLHECSSGEKAALGAAVLGVWGGLGAWIGHTRKTVDWSDVPMPSEKQSAGELTWQVSPMLSRTSHGVGFRLRLAW